MNDEEIPRPCTLGTLVLGPRAKYTKRAAAKGAKKRTFLSCVELHCCLFVRGCLVCELGMNHSQIVHAEYSVFEIFTPALPSDENVRSKTL